MEKEATRLPPAEDTSSTTDVDDKETAPPSRSEDKKDVDIAMSSPDEQPKTPEKVSGEEKSDDEYPKGMALFFIMLGLNLAVFLVAIDQTIIATAIPKITDRFNSLDDVGWYASAYMLTTGAFQLLYGRLYSTFSIKYVFISSISIFELGSLVCGVTPSSIGLIVGRAIAGVGAAGLFSGALIILAHVVPLRKRPTFMGSIGGMWGIASVAGPLLGGVFTDRVTWRLCFYINLPLGAVTIVAIMFLFHDPKREAVASIGWVERLKTFDLYGNVFLMPAIISLFLALQWGGSKYPWGNGRIIALFVVFGVLITGFVAVQFWRPHNAMMPPHMIARRSIWAACVFSFLMAGGFFTLTYYIPIWFQAVKGVSAVASGIRNLPLILGVVATSIIVGGLVTAVGYYTPFMIASTICMSIGSGLLTTLMPDSAHPAWIGYQAFAGLGVGMGMQLPLIAVQTVLPLDEVPTGTAVVVFAQTLGGAITIAIAQSVFQNKLIEKVVQYAPGIDPAVVFMTGATSIHSKIPAQELPGVILAYDKALTQVFLVAVATGALTIIGSVAMEWKSVKKANKKVADAEGGSGESKVTVEEPVEKSEKV
ncbi:major facilitator superfamily domain-containing protein [Hyaloscypha finlandica]|nr:major facilitator superfamily domain-containing protein [Hyaloscypha finlandica]